MSDKKSDGIPDFDGMTPEELERWKASLMITRGRTDAEMAEMAKSRVQEVKDFIPWGWTKESWEAHLAKEQLENPPDDKVSDSENTAIPDFLTLMFSSKPIDTTNSDTDE